MSGHVIAQETLGTVELVTIAGGLLDGAVHARLYRVNVPRAGGEQAASIVLTGQELADLELLAGNATLEHPADPPAAPALSLPDDWDVPGDHHTDPDCPRNGDDPLGTPCTCSSEPT